MNQRLSASNLSKIQFGLFEIGLGHIMTFVDLHKALA